ncbi:MAG: ester cyclase [Candidatus Rokubacteria bacterium]|nr:ester cyclase [Candidatus Rokubacteria bacterium]
MTPAEHNWQVLLAHLEAEKRCDFDGTLEGLAEDCVFEIVPLGLVAQGKAEVAEVYRSRFRDFPDLHTEVTRVVLGEEAIVLEGFMCATPRGRFWGLPARGRPIRVPAVLVVPFRDGRMLGERAYFDSGDLKRQLGL